MPAVERIDPKTIFTADEWARLTSRESWRGMWLVAHCWGMIAAAVALVTIWPNPLTWLLAVMIVGTRQLGLAILELLLFTEGANCLTLGAGVPAQEIAGATKAYKPALVVLLFDRGISGKIAGQEIRSLRQALPADTPLIVSGRAVNLLAKPIENAQVAADFNSVMSRMRAQGLLSAQNVARLENLPEEPQRA